MGRGSSKAGGGGKTSAFTKEAEKNVRGMTGYNVTTANGDKMEFFFIKDGGETLYTNSIGGMPEITPNNWSEKQMIERIKGNGGSAEKYSKKELVEKEARRLEYRAKTSKVLDEAYARNKVGDQVNKAYRNTRKANRIARRK